MATRKQRLAQFQGLGNPPPELQVQLLCEDHCGTYQLPFTCRWIDGQWQNVASGDIISATVIGWRVPQQPVNR